MSSRIFHFRILLDHEDEVFRDIEISDSDTFESLHKAIIESFEFSGNEMASFYMSNEDWDKGEEITQMDMGGFGDEGMKSMSGTELAEMIKNIGDKVLYLYDFMRMWIFFIELVDLKSANKDHSYPRVVLSVGDAPDESAKELVDSFPVDFDSDLDLGDLTDDEGFENIDDYEDSI
jgi:hypothetical protein